ncbi:SMC family protein [Acidicapsa acidisoli]|uniref:hypothetical protein n=1 Tax=Acidicapsa acidisoli TaxID=1615681 RepID=UPI0021DFC878|nr:hypothetical protein [Acidicapsa acidisoli]
MIGFQLRTMRITGLGLPPAEITFGPGLNVVSGASDTGKSFLFQTIDYMFGAAGLDLIPEARAYSSVELEIESAEGRFFLSRNLQGGEFELREGDLGATPKALGDRLNSSAPDNISAFLMRLSGLDGKKIRKNVENELQNLSFRNLARFVAVNEEEIIKRLSPIHSGDNIQKTAESNTFKLFLTGHDDAALVRQKKLAVAKAELQGQLALLEKLMEEYRDDLGENPAAADELSEQLERLNTALAAAKELWNANRSALDQQLQEKRALLDAQAIDRARSDELRTQIARFQLLDKHYQSDISRLDALWEAGSLFPPLSTETCPLCGASQNSHVHEETRVLSLDVKAIRQSCEVEKAKIELLRKELISTIEDLSREAVGLRKDMKERRELWNETNRQIDDVLRLSVKESESEYSRLSDLRFDVKKKIETYNRIAALESRYETATNQLSGIKPGKRAVADLPTAAITAFTGEFSKILEAWQFPVKGPVSFDTQAEDFFIGIRRRREQGKGSRALTHAAFTIALLSYCASVGLPHPGLVVLDSPLITFRDKDHAQADADLTPDVRLRLKDRFYRDLATRVLEQQVIIFENEEPAEDIQPLIVFHHFTGDPMLQRCGFFPVAESDEVEET